MGKYVLRFFILPLIMLAACSTTEGTKETKATKAMLTTFNNANYYFAKGKYEPAKKEYQKILDEFPDSLFRIHALLGVADSYYMMKEYYLAVPMYRRFRELYPLDQKTGHAFFYEGMGYYRDIVDVEKDQSSTRKSLEVFTAFLNKNPNHTATDFVKEKIAILSGRIEEKILTIAEFYYRIDAFGSCIGRVDDLLLEYPDTHLKPSALLLKGNAYFEEEAFLKAKAAFAQVVEEFPDTEEGREAAVRLRNLAKM